MIGRALMARIAPIHALTSLLIVLLSASWLLIGSDEALASCAPTTPSKSFANSEFVFSGVSIARSLFYNPYADHLELSNEFHNSSEGIYVFKVDTVWKGQPYEYVYLRTAHRHPSGYGFTLGEEYLVYALTAESVSSSFCSRTGLLTEAQEDLDWLGEGQPPEAGRWGPGPRITRDWLPADAVIEKLAKSARDLQYELGQERSRQPDPTPTPAPTPRPSPTAAIAQAADPAPVAGETDILGWLIPTVAGVAGVLAGALTTTLALRRRHDGT